MYKHIEGGFIEVICGPMFSSKTETLIGRVTSLEYAKQKIKAFKPKVDNRYSESDIVSHSGSVITSYVVDNSEDILNKLMSQMEEFPDVVVVDEVQFFDEGIIEVIEKLANIGVRVIAAGLDQDFQGKPFRIVADLMARAELVTKLSAVCVICGAAATKSFKTGGSNNIIEVGERELYEARCRNCYFEGEGL